MTNSTRTSEKRWRRCWWRGESLMDLAERLVDVAGIESGKIDS